MISVQLRGSKRIQKALQHAEGKLSNMTGLMGDLARMQYQRTIDNFKKQSFGGEKWDPLEKSTQRKPVISEAGNVLREHRGADNILRPTTRHIFAHIAQSHTRDEAKVFLGPKAADWAFAHNFGIPMPQGWQMPQRTFLGISDEDEEAIVNAIDAYVERALSQ